MPAGLLPNDGLTDHLNNLLKGTEGDALPWELLLWTNDITPDANTQIGDLVEATFGGYDRVTMDVSEWTEPTVEDGCAHSTWGTVATVWFVTAGPAQTIRGCAYLNPTSNTLAFIQRFDPGDIAPIVVGGKVSLLPQFTLNSSECG